jgi:hypothetical protein
MSNEKVSIGSQVQGATMAGGGGTYFIPGLYDLTVSDVKVFAGQTDGIPTVAVEFIVDKYVPKGTCKIEDRPVGTTVSWVQKLRPDIKKTILGNLKAMALTVIQQLAKNAEKPGWNELGEDQVTSDLIDNHIFCNNSKIVGMKMRSEAYEHVTKGKAQTIVLNKWSVI